MRRHRSLLILKGEVEAKTREECKLAEEIKDLPPDLLEEIIKRYESLRYAHSLSKARIVTKMCKNGRDTQEEPYIFEEELNGFRISSQLNQLYQDDEIDRTLVGRTYKYYFFVPFSRRKTARKPSSPIQSL